MHFRVNTLSTALAADHRPAQNQNLGKAQELGLLSKHLFLNGHKSCMGFAVKRIVNRQMLEKTMVYEHPLCIR
jgi:hypothetical protein